MPRTSIAAATAWITAAAQRHGDTLVEEVATRLGVGARSALRLIARLVEAGWLATDGHRRRPHYRPGALRQVVQRYALTGLREDQPWRDDFAPCFSLPPHIRVLAQHAFTELLNNAIEHSGGATATVSMRQTPLAVQLLVSDDGCGLFRRLDEQLGLDDPAHAMLELTKGKLTSAPERHRGHGLHLVARTADVFDLHANRHAFLHRRLGSSGWQPGRPLAHDGTSVFWSIALDSPRTLDDALRAASLEGAGYAFETTRVPLALLLADGEQLVARSQARRVAQRLGAFRRAEIDFSGIDIVGDAFVDELFRVCRNDLPATELMATGAAPRVAALLASGR